MSLINNMLKDLEKRKSKDVSLPSIALTDSIPTTQLFSYKKMILLSGLLLLLTIFYLLAREIIRTPHLIALQQIQEIEKSPLIPTTKENTEWLQPISILGVTLQVKDNITEISFLLDHIALYRLSNGGLPNQFYLTIEHSQLKSELPLINSLNTSLQRIETRTINGHTRFSFYTYPGAAIKYVNLANENNNPELVIAIEYQAPSDTNSSAKNPETIITPTPQGSLSQHYQVALESIKIGDETNAINQLTTILKINPAYHHARVSLAALWIDKKNLNEAKQLINKGLTITPDYIPFIELKARILTTEGNTKQALATLQSVSANIEDYPDFYAMMAALYEHSNNNLLAANIYRKLLAQHPNNGNWWYGLGVALEKLGQIKSASEAYTRALTQGQLHPKSILYLQQHLQTLKETSDDKK